MAHSFLDHVGVTPDVLPSALPSSNWADGNSARSNMDGLPYKFLGYLPSRIVNEFDLYSLSPLPLSLLLVVLGNVLFFILLTLRQRLLPKKPVEIYHAPKTVGIKRGRRSSDGSLIVEEIPLAALLRRDCPRLTDPKHKGATFSPTPYIASGHMQTIFAALFADLVTPQLTYVRELIYLPDGGNVALDWYPHIPTSDADLALPIIVILHGLTGGSHESYVQDVVRDVSKAGYFSVVANFRGCAKTELTSMQLYCGAYTGDLRHAIGYIRRKSPVVPLFGVGFSLGANVLTKFVGETGDNCPFIGAVSIGNPFDLLLSSHLMHRSWIGRNIYSKRMTQNLIRVFKQHMHAFVNAPFDVSQVLNAKFIYEFDDFLTRKAFKYRTVHEYYRRGSSAQYVPDIRIPMLLFSALDDPIAPKEAIPTFEVKENPFVVLATTQHGGHLGWFSGVTPKRWFAGPVGEFIRSIVEAYQSLPPREQCRPVSSRGLALHGRRGSFAHHLEVPPPVISTSEQQQPGPPRVVFDEARRKQEELATLPPTVRPNIMQTSQRQVAQGPHEGTIQKSGLLSLLKHIPRSRLVTLIFGLIFGLLAGQRRRM